MQMCGAIYKPAIFPVISLITRIHNIYYQYTGTRITNRENMKIIRGVGTNGYILRIH